MAVEDAVSPAEARGALARVLESPEFAQAARLSAFLRYVVTEALEGREAAIKGYSIAVDVFERPPDFDQSADPIVRVEASRLRRALAQYYQGSGDADPIIIELPRGGYVPAFRRRAEVPAAEPEPDEAEPAEPPDDGPEPELAPFRPTVGVRRFRAAVITGLVLALGALGYLVWDAMRREAGPQSTSAAVAPPPADEVQHRPTVAVIPLDSLSTDPNDAVLARGLGTEIAAQLARFREIIVYSAEAGSVRPAHGYLLTGSLGRAGSNIRITMQLTDVARGETVWSATYDRAYAVDDLLNLQRDIARNVATTVAQPYGAVYERERERAVANPSMQGYACVLRAYDYWRSLDPAEHLAVRDCLEATIKREPQYASAWYALTFFYLDEYRYSYNVRPDAEDPLDRALAAAQKAVSLAPTDARSYEALYAAYFFRGDLEGFKRAGADALRLNPNNPEIIADYGNRLALSGQWDEGIALVKRAMDMNPGHPGWYQIPLLLDAYRRGNYSEALALTERMNMPKFYRTWVFLAMIRGQLGDTARAATALQEVDRLNPAFRGHVRDEMRKWGFRPDLVETCIDGLRKAGLVIPDQG